MYKEFFNLKENPFSITADPSFFFSSANHKEAYSHLIYGIEQRKGIIVVTGEIGTGKTTLCKTLLSHMNSNIKTALILNPTFSDVQMLRLIIKDFGIEGKFRNKFDLINALNNFLLDQTNQGMNLVLIIDEAQSIKEKQLEQIRLLSNLETAKEKLLQIILVGQPELCDKLKVESLRQLDQRILVRYHIFPLNRDETEYYIEHRLKVAEASDANPRLKPQISDAAYDRIFEISKGTPRLINIICDRALLACFSKDTRNVTRDIIFDCAKEAISI